MDSLRRLIEKRDREREEVLRKIEEQAERLSCEVDTLLDLIRSRPANGATE